jgi:hypothetical protein
MSEVEEAIKKVKECFKDRPFTFVNEAKCDEKGPCIVRCTVPEVENDGSIIWIKKEVEFDPKLKSIKKIEDLP